MHVVKNHSVGKNRLSPGIELLISITLALSGKRYFCANLSV
ncbi:hypothetical protein SCARR_01117 [Pontiella sulfatireligans]|uniref:Uncharacterized protein n=1 Tax=Pontiella sulfatireligans TaxID=2750658 RepID=A0A6C2UI24_9BACT|nr:hypothetical protein SCARR_01117 [Pontiella sulfatireligans]